MKRVLLCFVMVASMLGGLLVAAPAALACTGTTVQCYHGRYDMYGPDKWPTGFNWYYSFSKNIADHGAWEGRATDGYVRYNTVASNNGINIHWLKAPAGTRFLDHSGVNWTHAIFSNFCSPTDFSWSEVPGSNIIVAEDVSFVSEGNASNVFALSRQLNCGGVRRGMTIINDQGPSWYTGTGIGFGGDTDLLGVMVHEFGHVVGFGQTGASNCNDFYCQLNGGGPGEWPGSLSGNEQVPCDQGNPSQGDLDTMCPVMWNYLDSYYRRTLEHDDTQEFLEGY